MPPADYPTTASFYDGLVVHLQSFDRCTTTSGSAKYKRAACIPAKMIGPALAEWVKERHFDSSQWINTVLLGGFVDVAGKTDLTKIFGNIRSSRPFWDDVIDVHCLTGVELGGMAIRASSPISYTHQQTQCRRDGH